MAILISYMFRHRAYHLHGVFQIKVVQAQHANNAYKGDEVPKLAYYFDLQHYLMIIPPVPKHVGD